jgi:peptidoglycan hydrolase-like protein with peptidoglycan-binding domain
VQNKLCQLGIDPGPVDGTENSTKYRPAIRAFQSRQNIPVTGNPDAVTLQAMDLDNAQSLAAAIGGGSLIPGVGVGTTSLLPYLMVGAFGLSGMFLFYAVRKYKRQAIRKNGRPVVRLRKSRWLFGRQKTTWGFPQYDAVVDGISEYPFKVATITYDYDDRERGQFLPPKIWQATVEVISRDFKGLGLGRTYQHLHPLMANWKYIIYGKTPEEVAKKIQALVEAKKLKETIYYDY